MHVLQRGSAMHKLALTSSIPEPRQDAFCLHARRPQKIAKPEMPKRRTDWPVLIPAERTKYSELGFDRGFTMPPSSELLRTTLGNLECRQTPVFPGLYGVVLGSDDAAIAGAAN
ncbi:hypothetical protein MY4038_006487 [Beauveria bassiana]